MHISFDKTTKISTDKGSIWDYPIDQSIGLSLQTLQGRGPSSGSYVNNVCDEIYFIISGEAVFNVDGKNIPVSKNDLVKVPEKTPHSIQTTGAEPLTFITITRPDWFEEQANIVQ